MDRQPHSDDCTLAQLAIDLDSPVMDFHDFLNDGQAQPGAWHINLFGPPTPIETLEDMR